jgi:hypothetical protein
MNISEIMDLYGPLAWPNYIVIPVGLLLFFGAWYVEIYKINKGCEWDKFAEEQKQFELNRKALKEKQKLDFSDA